MRRNVEVSNSDDIIDSRDVIARIEELEGERESLVDAVDEAKAIETKAKEKAASIEDDENDDVAETVDRERAEEALEEWDASEEADELKALKSLQDEGEGYSDWNHGETLIRESYFESYARDLAEDLHGDAIRDASWPFDCIDWGQAVNDLKMGYTSVEFDGVTYWTRS
jgi:hypothetical protein